MNPLAPAAALALLALSAPAQAQTWGQPYNRGPAATYGQPWYGAYAQASPLSEANTGAYARTGAAADGYTWGSGPAVYGYGHDRSRGYGYRDHHRYGQGYGYGRYDRPSRPGYRDEWGYNDDRPPSRWR